MENNLTYTRNGDYLIPDLKIEVPEQPLGKYGRMRQKYLKEHRPILWNQMILEETLFPHLLEIDETATNDDDGEWYDGNFVNEANVYVEQAQQDAQGRTWLLVRYLYGAEEPNGEMAWTDTATVWSR